MLNQNFKLKVYHNSTNYSNESFDFSRDANAITLLNSDYLYVGYYKPINQIYIQLETPNVNSNSFTAEYYNGSTWVSLNNIYDDTKGFTRSGFISWDREQANQSVISINSDSQYYIRLQPSVSQSATIIQAIGFIFVDDNDLKSEVPEITNTQHLTGKTSHILTHVAVRNQIMQELNNKNYYKINPTTGLKEDLTCWDILDANQIKQAAIFLALSKIYFNFSDQVDDKFSQKSNYYLEQYRNAIQLSRLSLDENDNGISEPIEQIKTNSSFVRMVR